MTQRSKIPERISLLAGVVLLTLAGLVWIDGIAHSRSAVTDFERARIHVVTPAEQVTWSEGRKSEYESSLSRDAGAPIADAQTQIVQKPGRVVTSHVISAAIVEAVNKETRELKVIDASGKRFTMVADDLVANFDQIEPRDRIVVEYLESIAIVVVPAGTPTMGEGVAIELAPLGDKPGITGVTTFVVSATVESLNLSDRIATLRYEDGTTQTIKVADDVPLDLVEIGDEVRFRITDAIAISVRPADTT